MNLQYTLRNYYFLYIIQEGLKNENSKIGICSGQLWERLRKLQQGNPRNLFMPHLWLGEKSDVEWTEKRIKDDYCNYKSEWSNYSSEDFKDKVDPIAKNNDLVYLSMNNILPYKSKTANSCRFRHLDPSDINELYNAGRLFPDIDSIQTYCGDIYDNDWKKLWPVEEDKTDYEQQPATETTS